MNAVPWAAVTALAALAFAGCAADPPADAPVAALRYPATPEGSLRFLVIGDHGNGDEEHFALARGMATACEQRGCDFVITVGDNIYPNGVRSPYDAQFEEKFEIPFAGLDLPFYLSLGNHDNGNGAGSNPIVAEHQIAYTNRTDRMSDMWNMPARNYAIRRGDVELFAIDSGPQEVSQNVVWTEGSLGPKMAAWTEQALAASDATWKIVYAHHPYLSNGLHGNAGIYDNVPGRGLPYKQFLESTVCGEADVYFAGHDHDLEWLEQGPQCPGTELLISGGGGHVRAKGAVPDNPAHWQAYDQHGFLWVDITGDTFTGVFVDFDGNVLYERSVTKA